MIPWLFQCLVVVGMEVWEMIPSLFGGGFGGMGDDPLVFGDGFGMECGEGWRDFTHVVLSLLSSGSSQFLPACVH